MKSFKLDILWVEENKLLKSTEKYNYTTKTDTKLIDQKKVNRLIPID